MYTTYEFYTETYGGSMSEADFTLYEKRAEAQIRYLTMLKGNIFQAITPEDTDYETVCMAVRAAAEAVGSSTKQAEGGSTAAGTIKSETTDGYSVTYVTETENSSKTAEEKLLVKINNVIRPYLLPIGWMGTVVRNVSKW